MDNMPIQLFTYHNYSRRKFFVNRQTYACSKQLQNEIRLIFRSVLDSNTQDELSLNVLNKYIDLRVATIMQVLDYESQIDKNILKRHLKDYIQMNWEYHFGKLATTVYYMFDYSEALLD